MATIDHITGEGILAAESLAFDTRERLADMLATHRGTLSEPEITSFVRDVFTEATPVLIEAIAAASLAAWMAGFDGVYRKIPADIAGVLFAGKPPVPPHRPMLRGLPSGNPRVRLPLIDAAVENLASRQAIGRETFEQLTDSARQKAFTIAGEMSQDTIGRVQDLLRDNVRSGASLDDFRQSVVENLEASSIGPAHLENVFRTNVQSAYSAGHETLASNRVVQDLFPYQEYLPIRDSRVRDTHLAMASLGLDGTGVYRRDDPIWNRWTPPCGYNCRCGVNLLTVDAAARKGVQEAIKWRETGEPPVLPEWRDSSVLIDPDPGFGARPAVGVAL